MSAGIGFRFFLFELDGTLRRLSARTFNGMVHGEDSMPGYAGQRLRTAYAVLELEGKRPVSMRALRTDWWDFDERGAVQRSLAAAAIDSLDNFASGPPSMARSDGTLDLSAARRVKRPATQAPWTPTAAEVTRLVEAIWPKTTGRPAESVVLTPGTAKRRHPVSYAAKNAVHACRKHLLNAVWALGNLSEHDLKGLISAIEDEICSTEQGHTHLWRGLQGFVGHELAVRKARRTRQGKWYAWVERLMPDGDDRRSWQSERLEERACESRDAAVAASREMLRKYADRFDHDARIEADVCPEIEWGD